LIIFIIFFGASLFHVSFLLNNFCKGDDLEEGEIAGSGDSHMDHQQSGSWIHDRDEGEGEQVLQKPKIKRKRSLRVRPRHAVERPDDKSGSEMKSIQRGESSLLADYKYQMQTRMDTESKSFVDKNAGKHDKNATSLKNKQKLPSRKVANTSKLHGSPQSNRLNCTSGPSDDGEHPRESWEGKLLNSNGSSVHGTKTTEIIQRGVCVILCLMSYFLPWLFAFHTSLHVTWTASRNHY